MIWLRIDTLSAASQQFTKFLILKQKLPQKIGNLMVFEGLGSLIESLWVFHNYQII